MSVSARYCYEDIPPEMKARDAWVTFQEILRPGRSKADKPPFIAGSRTPASSTNHYTWRSFADAERDVRRGKKSGVGYCLQDSGLVAIDLDRVRDPATGWIVPWAMRLVERFACYSDISVSLTGLHILARGRLPPDSRHKIEFSDESVLEIWDSGRYLVMTGNLVGPEFSTIRDHDFTNFWPELEETMKAYAPFRDGARIDLEEWLKRNRIRILSKKPENGKTTFEIGCPGTHGDYPKDDGKAFAIQFPDGALACGCQHSSCSFSKETGNHWSELRTRYEPRAAGYRTNRTNGKAEEERDFSRRYNWPDPLAEEAYHGVAGEIVKAIEPHSEADPAALLVQLLVGCGNMIGRKPYFVTEETRQYTALYTAIAGLSAKARKGTSYGRVSAFLRAADTIWANSRVLGGLSSGEGVIWHVRDPMQEQVPVREKGRIVRYEAVDSDPGVDDKRLMIFEPEFARVLQSGERDTNTLFSVLRQAYDGEPLGILTKKNAARCTQPHISMVAHITKDEVRRLLTDTAKTGGFANRYLWICSRRTKELPEGGGNVDFGNLKDRLRTAIETAGTITEVRRDEEAREIWRTVYHDLSEGRPGMFGAIIARAEAQVVRLSTLYALLDGSALIRAQHLKAALAVWKYAEDSARFLFGDAIGDPTADEILKQLRYCPEGMTRTEIRQYFQRNKSSAEISCALGVLQEYGLAKMEREQNEAGRPTERWYAITLSATETTKDPAAKQPQDSPLEFGVANGGTEQFADDLMSYAAQLASLLSLPTTQEQLTAISKSIRARAAATGMSIEDACLRLAGEAALAFKEHQPLPFELL